MPKLNDGIPEDKEDCIKYLPILKQIAWGFEPEDINLGCDARAHSLVCDACGQEFFEECEKAPSPEIEDRGVPQSILDTIAVSCAPITKSPH